ncbi:MAG: metabolite traffic protein EboE [Verrucomicrobiota bacterium]
MQLQNDIHLGYCTNIHRGESWTETFDGLKNYTDAVRRRVCPNHAYGIGLRLSAAAAAELTADREKRDQFRSWLEKSDSYVFTINGFPYGTFHGGRVKEQVYVPDWSSPDRLAYTNELFDLLAELAPGEQAISVSSLPGSFKEFVNDENRSSMEEAMKRNLRSCSEHIESLRERTGRDIHLGLEPEPLGLFETSKETVFFFEKLKEGLESAEVDRIERNLGVNYDTCHLAIEYEKPEEAIARLRGAGIRVSKIHLSSALRLVPSDEALDRLEAFEDEVYLHQVVVAEEGVVTNRFRDLPDALSWYRSATDEVGDEWRVHFHVPIHSQPEALFADTREHITGLLEVIARDPSLCQHFEMETYTWEVLPEAMRARDVVDQLEAEYGWCLGEFQKHGLT